MQNASTFLRLSSSESVIDEWEILNDNGAVTIADIIAIVLGLCCMIVPGVIVLLAVMFRPTRKGYLCLTTWRLLYYERGEGTFVNYHRVETAGLEDIVSVHSDYQEGLGGSRTLWIQIGTKNEDQLSITVGETNRWLAGIPLVGRLFQRNTIGQDAYRVLPPLFALIQEYRLNSASPATFN